MNKLKDIDFNDKESIEKLYDAHEEYKRFSYLATHDLKSPLRHIKMYIDFLKKRVFEDLSIDDSEAKHLFSVVESSAERLSGIITNINVLREVSELPVKLEDVDLKEICSRVTSILLEGSDDHSVTCNVEWTNLPVVKGDSAQLFQLVFNLCSNALKYQDKAANPSVQIDFEENDSFWKFKVSDNGLGIKEKYIDKVFTPFTKLQSSSKATGNGLGLAIAKKIVERHRGEIWAESEPGQGSVFYFTISK